jgi:uncharacterized protein
MPMPLPLTAPYAASLTLIFVVLTQMVVITRNRTDVPLGDGGHPLLLQAIRRQANFVEMVPITLILLMLAEAGGSAVWLIHSCGVVLVLARLVHPFGIQIARPAHPARIGATVATTLVQLALVVTLLWQTFA